MKIITFFSLCLFVFPFLAQKDACTITDKKAIKALQSLKDEQDITKATTMFQELYSEYSQYSELPFIMANKSYVYYQKIKKDPKKSQEASKFEAQAYLMFASSYKKCSTFHADNLYYIASILVGRGETENAIIS